jgi:hypothetical protein
MTSITIGDTADPEITQADREAGETFAVPEASTAEPSEDFHGAKTVTIPVNPSRLAWGKHDHGRKRDIGEGDIYASYSADTIATAGKIRRAFRWQAQLMVTVSLSGHGGIAQAEAYHLIPLKGFAGTTMSYAEKIGDADIAEAARNDPNGFYHGMTVKHSSEAFVLAGPPVLFVAAEEAQRPDNSPAAEGEQLSLF